MHPHHKKLRVVVEFEVHYDVQEGRVVRELTDHMRGFQGRFIYKKSSTKIKSYSRVQASCATVSREALYKVIRKEPNPDEETVS